MLSFFTFPTNFTIRMYLMGTTPDHCKYQLLFKWSFSIAFKRQSCDKKETSVSHSSKSASKFSLRKPQKSNLLKVAVLILLIRFAQYRCVKVWKGFHLHHVTFVETYYKWKEPIGNCFSVEVIPWKLCKQEGNLSFLKQHTGLPFLFIWIFPL